MKAAAISAARGYWMVKSEPSSYSWEQFVKDGKTGWTGVRNFQARNNLVAMKRGDEVLFYHSVHGKEVVGVAKVDREAYPDATAEEGNWQAVDLVPAQAFTHPVPLATLKSDEALRELKLIRQSQLSVMPLTKAEFDRIVALGKGR